jgi:hypothetical protein
VAGCSENHWPERIGIGMGTREDVNQLVQYIQDHVVEKYHRSGRIVIDDFGASVSMSLLDFNSFLTEVSMTIFSLLKKGSE